ncbi:MAG: flagellar hook-length control protein FliK [Thermodesulfobacteriota bacterium]
MPQTVITQSPLASLADLFLDTFETGSSQLSYGQQQKELTLTFNRILSNSVKQVTEPSGARESGAGQELVEIKAPRLGPKTESSPRRSALEELERKVDEVGLPRGSVSLSKDDLPRIRQVLKDSGVDEEQIEKIMTKLSEGPLDLNRVLALVASAKTPGKKVLKLTEESLPLLGQFLQGVGLNAEAVQEVMESLQAGQNFGAEELRSILLTYGDKNLKGPTLAGADRKNLQQLLGSLGVPEKDLNNFWTRMEQTGGRLSLEALVGFLKSVERPEKLTSEQMDNINELLKKLKPSVTLKPQPHFNRIVSLLQALGDDQVDENFVSDNPAIQALRGGAIGARAVTRGAGIYGQSGDLAGESGAKGGGTEGQTLTGAAEARAGQAGGSSRTTATHLPSRLSESVVRQVVEKMVLQANNNQQRLTLSLEPQDLGRLNINLVLKNNSLQAAIVAENPQVKAALEEQLGHLREALAEQGLNLESFDVSLGWEHQPDDTSGQENFPWPWSGAEIGLAAEEEPLISATRPEIAPGRVDRRI